MFEVKKNNTDRHISHGTHTTHLRQADLGITLIHETFEQAQSEFWEPKFDLREAEWQEVTETVIVEDEQNKVVTLTDPNPDLDAERVFYRLTNNLD